MTKFRHLDLFSGIGGFALAAREVWGKEHEVVSFCEINPYAIQVLKKHWPNVPCCTDIRRLKADEFTTNTSSRCVHGRDAFDPTVGHDQTQRQSSPGVEPSVLSSAFDASRSTTDTESGEPWEQTKREGREDISRGDFKIDLLTGGFPCQPFSNAGKRKGKDDDRYLWPEMLRVIKEFKPRWIIGENVAGLLNMAEQQSLPDVEGEAGNAFKEGDTFDSVGRGILYEILESLENLGYEVQPFVIPACAVNAPHRRDRVWIVAHNNSMRLQEPRAELEAGRDRPDDQDASSHSSGTGLEGSGNERLGLSGQRDRDGGDQRRGWDQNWVEVATRFCGVDDGLPARLDGFELTKPAHRVERLKGLGNAIVPQVAAEIMTMIKLTECL